MRKWAGRILTTLSLLLLVGTVGMWVASQWASVDVWGESQVAAGTRPVVWKPWANAYRGSLAVGLYRNTLDLSDPGVAARVRARGAWLSADIDDPATMRIGNHPPQLSGWQWGGFGWQREESPDLNKLLRVGAVPEIYHGVVARSSIALAVPWWFLALCFALLPAHAAYRWRRARRRRRGPGQCRRCGYDCRATPHAGGPPLPVCPECGHPQPAPAAA